MIDKKRAMEFIEDGYKLDIIDRNQIYLKKESITKGAGKAIPISREVYLQVLFDVMVDGRYFKRSSNESI